MKILKFNAIWCSGCIVMKKIFKDIENDYPDILIENYDYDDDSDLVNKWNIGSIIPVLIFVDSNGHEITRLVGEKSKKEIINVIEGIV